MEDVLIAKVHRDLFAESLDGWLVTAHPAFVSSCPAYMLIVVTDLVSWRILATKFCRISEPSVVFNTLVQLEKEMPGPAYLVTDCSPLRAEIVLAGCRFTSTASVTYHVDAGGMTQILKILSHLKSELADLLAASNVSTTAHRQRFEEASRRYNARFSDDSSYRKNVSLPKIPKRRRGWHTARHLQ